MKAYKEASLSATGSGRARRRDADLRRESLDLIVRYRASLTFSWQNL